MKTFVLLFVLLVPVIAVADDADPVVLCDFDADDTADHWRRKGIGVEEITIPEDATVSGGRALRLHGSGNRGSIEQEIDVPDWRRFRALSIYVEATGTEGIEMRVRARSGRGHASMLKRFTVTPGPWREIVLPLAQWREDTYDQVSDFSHITRVEVQMDQGKGTVAIDDLRLLPGDRGNESCLPMKEDWLSLAFPNVDGRSYANDHFLLLTNARRVDKRAAKKLLARLDEGYALLLERYGVPGDVEGPVPVFFFATKAQYQTFFERLGDHFRVNIGAPESSGYSCLGVGASFYDRKYGWDRPAFVHEAMHAVLHRLLGLASNGNWIQEGLATAVQVQLYPWAVDTDMLLKHLGDLSKEEKGGFLPLADLLLMKRPSMKNYAQLVTVMEFLVERYAERLADVWKAVRATQTPIRTSGADALLETLDTDMPELHEEYVQWGTQWKPAR